MTVKLISTATGKIIKMDSGIPVGSFGLVSFIDEEALSRHNCLRAGLENLHQITTSRGYMLRIELEDWDGNSAYAEYK